MSIFSVITLLGGLALFLYGMEVMGDGLKNSSGEALKNALGKLTQNPVMGLITGMLVTAVIQSSTATIVLTVGLIGAGILDLKQSVSIVLGANIGTTVTAQIIRLMDIDSTGGSFVDLFKPTTLAPLAAIIGIVLIMFVKRDNSKTIGEIFLGFGVLFTGLITMTGAVEPLSQSPEFASLVATFSKTPFLGLAIGLVLTIVVQSSSAMVGIVQTLASTGLITFNCMFPIIMGINLGTCVTTAIVCSIGTSKDAKRTGVVHILFNTIGTILFMIALSLLRRYGALPGMWDSVVSSGNIADFQTIFNLATAIVLLPFTGVLMKLSMLIVRPDKKREEKNKRFAALDTLDEKLYISPSIALETAVEAIGAMGTIARDNLFDGIVQLTEYDGERSEDLLATEDRLDRFADTADNFLVGLSGHTQTQEDNRMINSLMQTMSGFERIGDYATNLDEMAQKLKKDSLSFSSSARSELDTLCDAIMAITDIAIQAFRTNDTVLAKKIEPLEEVIDDMVALLHDRHIDRLKAGTCTIGAGLIFLESLTYLERVADQCSSCAILILSQENVEILKNHQAYLRLLHEGTDAGYNADYTAYRTRYMQPLLND